MTPRLGSFEAGVLEATLFDVRSGTILFTLYERVHARSDETPCDDDRKLRAMEPTSSERSGSASGRASTRSCGVAFGTRSSPSSTPPWWAPRLPPSRTESLQRICGDSPIRLVCTVGRRVSVASRARCAIRDQLHLCVLSAVSPGGSA